MRSVRAGLMRERLVIQKNNAAFSVSTLTRSTTTATVTTSSAHGFVTGNYVTIAGATPTGYNGRFAMTVTGSTTFTYTVSASLATPATGTITATYTSDSQGGRKPTYTTFVTIPAELLPMRAGEQMQMQAVGSQVDYRFRVRSRPDLTPSMRALWTPTWPGSSPQQTLEIHGILPDGDGRGAVFLECGRLT